MATTKPIDTNDPEAMLVAGALVTPALASEAAHYITADDFTDGRLRLIWTTIMGMLDSGASMDDINPMTVASRCGAKRKDGSVLIARFCGSLLDAFPRFTSLVSVATRVHKRRTMVIALERMRLVAADIKEQMQSADGEVEDLDSRLASLSIDVASRSDTQSRRTVYRDLQGEVSRYFDSLAAGPTGNHIPTGIFTLDRRLGGGLRPGQLHSILGATGSGKTALASQFCDSAVAHGKRAIMFSMEVDPVDIYIRDVERRSGSSRWDLRSRHLIVRENALQALVAAQSVLLGSCGGKVVYGEPMSLEGIRQAILTERLRTGPIDLVAVDHAQVALPNATEKRGMPRYLEVKSIAEGLRAIGRQLGVAVILTAQMNPPPKDERPMLSLVRESKDIVNSAEVAIMIWHQKDELADGDVILKNSWLLADKVRAGQEGKIAVRYRGEIFRFEDLAGTRDEEGG